MATNNNNIKIEPSTLPWQEQINIITEIQLGINILIRKEEQEKMIDEAKNKTKQQIKEETTEINHKCDVLELNIAHNIEMMNEIKQKMQLVDQLTEVKEVCREKMDYLIRYKQKELNDLGRIIHETQNNFDISYMNTIKAFEALPAVQKRRKCEMNIKKKQIKLALFKKQVTDAKRKNTQMRQIVDQINQLKIIKFAEFMVEQKRKQIQLANKEVSVNQQNLSTLKNLEININKPIRPDASHFNEFPHALPNLDPFLMFNFKQPDFQKFAQKMNPLKITTNHIEKYNINILNKPELPPMSTILGKFQDKWKIADKQKNILKRPSTDFSQIISLKKPNISYKKPIIEYKSVKQDILKENTVNVSSKTSTKVYDTVKDLQLNQISTIVRPVAVSSPYFPNPATVTTDVSDEKEKNTVSVIENSQDKEETITDQSGNISNINNSIMVLSSTNSSGARQASGQFSGNLKDNFSSAENMTSSFTPNLNLLQNDDLLPFDDDCPDSPASAISFEISDSNIMEGNDTTEKATNLFANNDQPATNSGFSFNFASSQTKPNNIFSMF